MNTIALLPNWATPPRLILRGKTEISVSAAGREERTALITVPALSAALLLDSQEGMVTAKLINRFLRDNIGSAVAVPLAMEVVTVTSVDGQTLNCTTTTGRLFHTSRPCLIIDSTHAELFTANTITASTIHNVTVFTHTYAAGARVMPVLVTDPITENLAGSWLSGIQDNAAVEFPEALETAYAFPAGSQTLFRSRPLFPFRWNRVTDPNYDFSAETAQIESTVGIRRAARLETWPRTNPKGEIILQSREDIIAAFAFFTAIRGRWAALWLSSDNRDFQLVAPYAGGTELIVVDTGYAANEFVAPSARFILIRDGTAAPIPNEITAAVDNEDGTETLTLDAAVPALSLAACVSQLHLVRSTQDEWPLTFLARDLATLPVEFTELPDEFLPPDIIPTQCPPILLTPTTIPDAFAGVNYTVTFSAIGGEEPYTFDLYAGSLPTGLELHAFTGILEGIPT